MTPSRQAMPHATEKHSLSSDDGSSSSAIVSRRSTVPSVVAVGPYRCTLFRNLTSSERGQKANEPR